jgi:hypothetical protein
LRATVATQLDLVAAVTVTATEALRTLDDDSFGRDRLTDGGWEALIHFRSDEDIHAREPDYLAADQKGLRKWAIRLRGEDV